MPSNDPVSRPALRMGCLVFLIAAVIGAVVYGLDWLERNPQHDPRAPFVLTREEGWATPRKLAALRDGADACRAVLDRSGIAFDVLEPQGEGECLRADRVLPASDPATGLSYVPAGADATCAVHAGVAWWLDHRAQPAAQEMLGSRVVALRQLGTANCRRINGAADGRWSEHATGNAIDIAAFELEDGRTVSVLADWESGDERAAFLRAVRDGSCDVFGTALSPDYNAAHADHFHFDQAARGLGGFCR